MKQFNIHEAKTHLSKLIAAVEAGEEVVIARAGKPVAHIVKPPEEPKIYRRIGGWEGWEYDEEQFRAGDADILAAFEESIAKPFD